MNDSHSSFVFAESSLTFVFRRSSFVFDAVQAYMPRIFVTVATRLMATTYAAVRMSVL